MACHRNYVADLAQLTGSFLDHDDSINDRAPGLQLENGFQATSRIWKEAFQEDYAFEGGMYRGQLPVDFLRQLRETEEKREQREVITSPHEPSPAIGNGNCRRLRFITAATSMHEENKVEEVRLLEGGQERGRMYIRMPQGPKSSPACIIVFDNKGKVRAVSRILPRDQLPRRGRTQATDPSPLFEADATSGPPFLIQTPESDWGIAHLLIDSHQPVPLFCRLGSEFYGESKAEAESPYTGRRAVTLKLAGSGAIAELVVADPEKDKARIGKRWAGCFGCGSAAAVPLAVAHFPPNALAGLTCARREDEFCFAAVIGTWSILHESMFGSPLLPMPEEGIKVG